MRALLTLALALGAAFASADRLITIPTGTKVTLNTLKFDGLFEQSRARNSRYSVGAGLTDAIDVFLTGEERDGRRFRASLDFSYNFIPPITGVGPGLSFGVQDALGVTKMGRRFFMAITTREGFADSVNGSVPAEFTLGTYFGSVNAPFVGVMVPFWDQVRLLSEFNGRSLSGGFEIRPTPNLGVRAIFDGHDVLLGAQATIRF